MSDEFPKHKDLRTRQKEFTNSQLKNERNNLINAKRTLLMQQEKASEGHRSAAFYQNVPNKDEIAALVSAAAQEPPEPEQFRKHMAQLHDPDIRVVTVAVVKIRVLFTKGQGEFSNELISYNGVSSMMEFLQNLMYPHLQSEAAWILSNVSAGKGDETASLVHKGILSCLQKALACPFEEVILHLLYIIGNISADSTWCRNQVVASGLLSDIQGLPAKFPSPLVTSKITWILASVLRLQSEAEPLGDFSLSIFRQLIADFIQTFEFEVQSDCIFGLSKHVNLTTAEFLMHEEFLLKLRQFHEDLFGQKIQHNISLIGAIHDIISGLSLCQDSFIMDLINLGFLRNLHLTLCCPKVVFVIDGLVILSNFVVGSDNQISRVLAEPGLIEKVISLIHNTKEPRILKNAVWVLANMCATSSVENVQGLLQVGTLELFGDRLRMDEDPATLINVLEGMERLAEFFGRLTPSGKNQFIVMIGEKGMDAKLEHLQHHKSEKVYAKVLGFMEKYFEIED